MSYRLQRLAISILAQDCDEIRSRCRRGSGSDPLSLPRTYIPIDDAEARSAWARTLVPNPTYAPYRGERSGLAATRMRTAAQSRIYCAEGHQREFLSDSLHRDITERKQAGSRLLFGSLGPTNSVSDKEAKPVKTRALPYHPTSNYTAH